MKMLWSSVLCINFACDILSTLMFIHGYCSVSKGWCLDTGLVSKPDSWLNHILRCLLLEITVAAVCAGALLNTWCWLMLGPESASCPHSSCVFPSLLWWEKGRAARERAVPVPALLSAAFHSWVKADGLILFKLFTRTCTDRRSGSGFKFTLNWFRLDIRGKKSLLWGWWDAGINYPEKLRMSHP